VADRAAGRPERPLADLVAELRSESDRLDALSMTGDEAAAVRGVFSWSYRALAPASARAFRLLSLYPGLEPSVPATAAIVGTTPSTIRRLLDGLAGVHLVEESGRDGYRLHELVRLYAAERVREEDSDADTDTAIRRLITWVPAHRRVRRPRAAAAAPASRPGPGARGDAAGVRRPRRRHGLV